MPPLFAYGTLQSAELLREITGRGLRPEPATLRGFGRFAIEGRSYPGIVPLAYGAVSGTLYDGIDEPAWRSIDRYEGPLYERWPVEVRTSADGRLRTALAYVVRGRFRRLVSRRPWDPGRR